MTVTLPDLNHDRLIADRRDFHAHPELGYQEFRTAGIIEERLKELGYQVRSGVGKTGVVGVHAPDGQSGRARCVLLRADMDALPVQEENNVPFRSQVDGAMHACGHDGHMAVGLAVAERLAHAELAGAVKFAFQPAEEGGNGAGAMIEDGVMSAPRVDAAFGMHLWSYLPTGAIAVTPGPVFASADQFEVEIVGQGGHAAIPQHTIDPVVVGAHIVTALQTLVSRRRDPFEEAVLSVTAVRAGEAFNVIPERATLLGTVRTFGGEFYRNVPALIEEVAAGVATGLGARASMKYDRLLPPTVNDGEMAALMAEVAREIVGADNVLTDVRTMGGEDMSLFLEQAPGCYAFVGARNEAKGAVHPHHSPHFTIDEDALAVAADLLSRTAVAYLSRA
jgi:amidohydrolase